MARSNLLARRTRRMGVNAIREILKVVTQPGMVSMAGGIPAPESFPLELMEQLTAIVLERYGAAALQYDPTEGFGPLREILAGYLAKRHIQAKASDVLVSTGSQGALAALGMVLIDKGDKVAVEAPTYLGALQAFNPYEPEYVHIAMDDDGVIPESLDEVIRRHAIKFIYLVPTFQNPTGRSLSLERRRAIARLIQAYDVLLVEDDPYGALRYRGEYLPPIKSFAPDHVVYISTLSKVFAPGLRIGFSLAPEPVHQWMVIVKQGIDLHTTTWNQALAAEYIDGGHLDAHLPAIINLYRPRQEAMLEALERYFPSDYTWSRPEGGMFIWAEGPKGTNIDAIYERAIEKKVAFVPGKYFYTHPNQGLETMRLNFTMCETTVLTEAVQILSSVL